MYASSGLIGGSDQAGGADSLHGSRSSLSFLCAVRPKRGARRDRPCPQSLDGRVGRSNAAKGNDELIGRAAKRAAGQERRSRALPETSKAHGASTAMPERPRGDRRGRRRGAFPISPKRSRAAAPFRGMSTPSLIVDRQSRTHPAATGTDRRRSRSGAERSPPAVAGAGNSHAGGDLLDRTGELGLSQGDARRQCQRRRAQIRTGSPWSLRDRCTSTRQPPPLHRARLTPERSRC